MKNEPRFAPITQPFSADYEIVQNADVREYTGEEAIMDFDMYRALAEKYGHPVVGFIRGAHYQFKPARQIPAESAAIPETKNETPDALLIQK